jgi:hypothetical protein
MAVAKKKLPPWLAEKKAAKGGSKVKCPFCNKSFTPKP